MILDKVLGSDKLYEIFPRQPLAAPLAIPPEHNPPMPPTIVVAFILTGNDTLVNEINPPPPPPPGPCGVRGSQATLPPLPPCVSKIKLDVILLQSIIIVPPAPPPPAPS